MKRLTFDGNFCDIAKCADVCEGIICEEEACSQRKTWERLKAIEDILGDEYDIDRLKEAVLKQKEYEQFMERWKDTVKIAEAIHDIGIYRFVELAQADREGRAHILPSPRENTCGKCGNFTRTPGCGYGECTLRPGLRPYQSRAKCKRYTEKALE